MKINNYWKRFNIYEKSLAAFFIINILLKIINDKLLNFIIPEQIISYLFWLSLGLYLGFKLCKYESKRVYKKLNRKS